MGLIFKYTGQTGETKTYTAEIKSSGVRLTIEINPHMPVAILSCFFKQFTLVSQSISLEEARGLIDELSEPQEPSQDDTVRFCPECEKPNQFGELCFSCQTELERERRLERR